MAATFNPAELATLAQARATAKKLGTAVGGGVKVETSLMTTSGIYLPTWIPGPHADPEPFIVNPNGSVSRFFSFRFNNGAAGMNVGLIIDKFSRFPTSPAYVISELAAEAAAMV